MRQKNDGDNCVCWIGHLLLSLFYYTWLIFIVHYLIHIMCTFAICSRTQFQFGVCNEITVYAWVYTRNTIHLSSSRFMWMPISNKEALNIKIVYRIYIWSTRIELNFEAKRKQQQDNTKNIELENRGTHRNGKTEGTQQQQLKTSKSINAIGKYTWNEMLNLERSKCELSQWRLHLLWICYAVLSACAACQTIESVLYTSRQSKKKVRLHKIVRKKKLL